jgi:hypothetical protein
MSSPAVTSKIYTPRAPAPLTRIYAKICNAAIKLTRNRHSAVIPEIERQNDELRDHFKHSEDLANEVHRMFPVLLIWSGTCGWRAMGTDRDSGAHRETTNFAIFLVGNEVVAKVQEVSALIVGIGAIGCEYARYAAPFGFRRTVLIDNDRVEPSNLTRQALFRDGHRGQLRQTSVWTRC